jgi:hypothetical protein
LILLGAGRNERAAKSYRQLFAIIKRYTSAYEAPDLIRDSFKEKLSLEHDGIAYRICKPMEEDF